MDRFRFLALPQQASSMTCLSLDQGDAPSWCDNDLIGDFRMQVVVQ